MLRRDPRNRPCILFLINYIMSQSMPKFGVLNYKLHSLNAADELLLKEGKLLPLMEEFYTIQGEGFNTGKAAYFIRIGGCDVGCHWCDVKESWDANIHPLTSVNTIIDNVSLW